MANGRARKAPRPAPPDQLAVQLHALNNTLASLKLRLGVVAADPTCRFAQEPNLIALVRIVEDAFEETSAIGATISGRRKPARRKTRARYA